MTTFDITPGQFGSLTDEQQTAFDTFKGQVAQRFGPSSRDDARTWYDDVTILRYLRARRFDVAKAMDQFAASDAWRREIELDRLFATVHGDDLQHSRRHYPRFTGRRDVHGKPVYVYRPGSLTSERQKEIFGLAEKERFERIAVLTESMVRLTLPLASDLLAQEHPQTSEDNRPRIVSEVTTIVDFDGASLGLLWTLRNHLRQASVLTSTHFPETLGALALVNCPSFLSKIWSWAQKWFDEGTQKKMFIVSGPELKQGKLLALVNADDLPEVYGGRLSWRYEDEPACDGAIQAAIRAKQMPESAAEWQDGKLVVYDDEERKLFPGAVAPAQQTTDETHVNGAASNLSPSVNGGAAPPLAAAG